MYSSKVVEIGKKWLSSGKSGCIRAKLVVFVQKLLFSRKKDCMRTKLLYSGKSGCIGAKVVALGQKWLYSGKVVVIGQE